MYLKESSALQICIRNKLEKIKLKDYDNSNTFFNDFEKTINDLKNAGARVNEQEKLNYMLRTLPDSLSYIGDLVDAIKEDDRNCEFLKNKITMWETRNSSDNGKRRSNAFNVEPNKDKNCFRCGKFGHLIKDCRVNVRGNVRGAGKFGGGISGAQQRGGGHEAVHQHQSQLATHQSRGGRGRGSYRGNYS